MWKKRQAFVFSLATSLSLGIVMLVGPPGGSPTKAFDTPTTPTHTPTATPTAQPGPSTASTDIVGTVTDASTGLPIAAVTVSVSPLGAVSTTDAQGGFALRSVNLGAVALDPRTQMGRVTITLSADAYGTWTLKDADVYPNDTAVVTVPMDKESHTLELGTLPTASRGLGLPSPAATVTPPPSPTVTPSSSPSPTATSSPSPSPTATPSPSPTVSPPTSSPGTSSVTPKEDTITIASCTGYYSNATPPGTIRVYHNNPDTGGDYQIHVVAFKDYVKQVLPSEWYASWEMAALQAGAMAVRNYGWYWVNNSSAGGQCYDVDSTSNYQVWNPYYTHTRTDEAVESIWAAARMTWNEGTGFWDCVPILLQVRQ